MLGAALQYGGSGLSVLARRSKHHVPHILRRQAGQFSPYFQSIVQPPLRGALQLFRQREVSDPNCPAMVNMAIGSIKRRVHPNVYERFRTMSETGPMAGGQFPYPPTAGTEEAQEGVRQLIRASGGNADGLHVLITNGGSEAMDKLFLMFTHAAGSPDKPVAMIGPYYANYIQSGEALGRPLVGFDRTMDANGTFQVPTESELRKFLIEHDAGTLVILPSGNPTGEHFSQDFVDSCRRICRELRIPFGSDEAYRGIEVNGAPSASIWKNRDVTHASSVEETDVEVASTSKICACVAFGSVALL